MGSFNKLWAIMFIRLGSKTCFLMQAYEVQLPQQKLHQEESGEELLTPPSDLPKLRTNEQEYQYHAGKTYLLRDLGDCLEACLQCQLWVAVTMRCICMKLCMLKCISYVYIYRYMYICVCMCVCMNTYVQPALCMCVY